MKNNSLNDRLSIEKDKIDIQKVRKRNIKPYSIILIFTIIFTLIVGGTLTFHAAYYTRFIIIGQSMYPTLNIEAKDSEGNLLGEEYSGNYLNDFVVEYGIVDTHLDINKLERFDIVAFYTTSSKYSKIVKRVIGFPNENIKYDSVGQLFVNDVKVDESLDDKYLKETGIVNTHLGDNEYYLLGDNRANSDDSRNKGDYTSDLFIGKLVAIEGHCTVFGNSARNFSLMWPRWY